MSEYRRRIYRFDNVDVIILEGIFLYKNEYTKHFDLKVWVECSFKTALQRAIARSQEGLLPRETVEAFRTIYFPAQVLHFSLDNPYTAANIIFDND